MTSRSRRYFFTKRYKKFVLDPVFKMVQEEIDREILEKIVKEAEAQGIEFELTPEGKLLLNQDI